MPEKSKPAPWQKAAPRGAAQHQRDSEVRTAKWRRFRIRLLEKRRREAVLKDLAICVECAAEGKPYILQAVELHHIEPRAIAPERLYDPTNCVFLCKRHHSQETQRMR